MTVTTRSVQLGTLCLFIAWAFSAVAQVQIDGLHVSASGAIDAGYSAENSNNGGGSSNGVGLGGSGDFHGYYYNPNFLSFDVLPYYSRSNSNSESQSITDSSGYSANSNISPGVGLQAPWALIKPGIFGHLWHSRCGWPDHPRTTVHPSPPSWAFLANHHLPSLNLAYGQSSGNSSLLGSDVSNSTSGRNFGASTGFHLAGFGLGFGYQHQQYASTSNISSAGAASWKRSTPATTTLMSTLLTRCRVAGVSTAHLPGATVIRADWGNLTAPFWITSRYRGRNRSGGYPSQPMFCTTTTCTARFFNNSPVTANCYRLP